MGADLAYEALVSDYVRGRDDERGFYSAMGSTLAGAIAVTGLILNLLSSASCLNWAPTKSCTVDDSFIAMFPMVLLAAFAYQTWLALDATFRSFYLRGLERQIRKELAATEPEATKDDIPVASFAALTAAAHSQTRFNQPVSLLVGLIWSVMGFVVLALIAVAWIQVEWYWRLVMIAVYVPATLTVVVAGCVAAFDGRRYSRSIIEASSKQAAEPLLAERTERATRTPISYFLAPGVDHLPTAFVTGIGFAVPIWAGWATPAATAVGDFLVAAVIFEFLLQQSKYAFNDIRSARDDLDHPLRETRGRLGSLGVSQRSGILIALASIGWRLLLFTAALLLIPGNSWILLIGFGGLVVHVGIYEWLRGWRSGLDSRPRREAVVTVAIILWVGVGYALRLWFGWAFALGSLGLDNLGRAACLFAVALGSFMCALTWEIEGATYMYVDPLVAERMTGRFRPVVKGKVWISPGIEKKPHVKWLTYWSLPQGLESQGIRMDYKLSRVPLKDLTVLKLPMRLLSPHFFVGVVAILSTVVVGAGRVAWVPATVVLANVAALAVLTVRLVWGSAWTVCTLLLSSANVGLWLATGADSTMPGALFVALLWVALAIFGGNSPERIFGLPTHILHGIRAAGRTVATWVLGRPAIDTLTAPGATGRAETPVQHEVAAG